MAINPSTKYTGQIDTSDSTGYPYGKAQNVTAAGDGTGTPLEQDWVNDWFGFIQALLGDDPDGAVTPSGTPEKVGASQLLDALDNRYATRPHNPICPTCWGKVQTNGSGGIASSAGSGFTASITGDSILIDIDPNLTAQPTAIVATYWPTTAESTSAYFCTIHSTSNASFTINVFDDTGTQEDSAFNPQIVSFIVMGGGG